MTSNPQFDHVIPATASPTVEFVSQIHWNPSTEINPIAHRGLDRAWVREYSRALDEGGFDYTLVPYFSSSPEPFVLGSFVGAVTERIKPVIALRPNHTFPLVAAQKLATLDQLTEGRALVHLISGGFDAEQRRQGDFLTKDERYARTSEYIDLLRLAWTTKTPVSHDGQFYRFEDFGPGFATYSGEPIPISIGGESDAAFNIGSAKADWYAFNSGASLAQTRADFDRVAALAAAAGRPTPRFWVTFRPIIARTDAQAWDKAYDYAARAGKSAGAFKAAIAGKSATLPAQSEGARRQLAYAEAAERYDRAVWTGTTRATGGGGASTALVGSPETVAAAILDYVDAGASVVSIRGYDTLQDAKDYGQYILPLVRQELAQRAATGRRGSLQSEHLGYYSDEFNSAADRASEKVGALA
ncbi:MAG: putative alkansulfonate monooxygenase [Frankiales bacterium]|nr:putative alkansulfonate monooxygenase [Frankiales bacterium]